MVTLTLYPNDSANSFVSNTDALILAEQFLGSETFTALSTDDQNRYLIIAYNNIINLTGITLPSAPTLCLQEAQVELAINDIVNGISTTTSAEIASAKVGPISVQYVENTSTSDEFPSRAKACLESYNAVISSSSQSRVYRG